MMQLERALATPGFTSDTKLLFLARAAAKAQVVVEIGSWLGRSTRALADNCPGVVYAVDDWRGPENSPQNRLHFEQAYDAFRANCADLIAAGKVAPLRVASPAAAEKFRELVDQPIDLLFIDGLHTHAAVGADLAAWIPLLRPGGLLCGDDFSDAWPGVISAVSGRLQAFDVADDTDLWFTRDLRPPVFAAVPSGTQLTLATPAYGGQVSSEYALAMVETTAELLRRRVPAALKIVPGDSLVPRARNGLSADFFDGQGSHLVFLDADVRWRAHDLLRLVSCPARHDVVCGIYPKKESSPKRWPLNFLSDAQQGLNVCPQCGAIEIAEGPTGFMAIRRRTFERVAQANPFLHGKLTEHLSGYGFFSAAMQLRTGPSQFVPEDFGFCGLVRGAGMRVWALPDIPLRHGGRWGCLHTWLGEEQRVAFTPPPLIEEGKEQDDASCATEAALQK
jgi:predicted O-methyltransferase YrrM